jgi:hypothetical protein
MHLEGGEVIVQHGEGVLFAGEVVERDVALAVELLERIEDEKALIVTGRLKPKAAASA